MQWADITKGYAHSKGSGNDVFIAINLRTDLYDMIDKEPSSPDGALKVLNIPGTNVCLFIDRVEK